MDSELAFGARTTRSNNFVGIAKSSGTADLPGVGPGAYETPSSLRVERPAPDAVTNAAFGSSSQRKFKTTGDTGVTVGPGSYDVMNGDRSLIDGSVNTNQTAPQPLQMSVSESEEMTARNEAMRVARGGSLYERKQHQSEAKKPTPGPGQYCVTDSHWGNGHGAVAMHSAFGVEAAMERSRQVGGSLNGQSGNAAVTWMRIPTAPTIPGKAQGFGYEEGMNGELIMVKDGAKRYTGKVGDVPGPGEYTPQLPTRNSRTLNFGAGSVRPEISHHIKPKPKVGDVFGSLSDSAIEDDEDRLMPSPPKPSSMFLSSARGQEAKSKRVSTTPGPGHYNKPSTLKGTNKTPEQLQFFGSTSQRFGSARNVVSLGGVPGPGAYGNPSSSFDRPKQRTSNQPGSDRIAFASSSLRSEFGGQTECEVGPGEYTMTGMSEELIRKQKRQNYVRREDFIAKKSQANTAQLTNHNDMMEAPGPTSYFSNYGTTSPIKKSGNIKGTKGDGGSGMMKGSVLRFQATEPVQQTSSFQSTGRDLPATNRARLAASGSQLGHGVDYQNRNDPNGIHRGGPLTASESCRVFTSNPVLALRESHKFQLAQGVMPQSRGPDLMRSTGRGHHTLKQGDTDSKVGPGSYEAMTSPNKYTHARSSRGVMDSKDQSRRNNFAGVNASKIDGPGPGEYTTRNKGSMLLPTFNAAIAESVRV